MSTRVENAKIACIDFNLNKFRCAMGVQITVDDPKALSKIREK
jgi:T-complex protein 1 subunit alpha